LRASLAQTLARVLPEPQASLAQGILLGIRENIPQSVKNDFARTGTAHLLVISGLHLDIVAGIMLSFGTWLFGRRHYLYVWLAMTTIWLYVLLERGIRATAEPIGGQPEQSYNVAHIFDEAEEARRRQENYDRRYGRRLARQMR